MKDERRQEIVIIVLNLVSKEFVRRLKTFGENDYGFDADSYVDYVVSHLFLYFREMKDEEKEFAKEFTRDYYESLKKIYVGEGN